MAKSFRCLVCGYVHIGENPPESCPVCGAPASEFEEFQDKEEVKRDGFELNAKEESKTGKAEIVIIGGGIAGLSAAEEIRKNSDDAKITIISNDNILPYYRLNLTRYIAKETDRESLMIHMKWRTQAAIVHLY